jgi:hypothetical protein
MLNTPDTLIKVFVVVVVVGKKNPLLSWKHLIDVHQKLIFKAEKNRWRARVTGSRCNVSH